MVHPSLRRRAESHRTRIMQILPTSQPRPHGILPDVVAKEAKLFFASNQMVKLIGLPELAGEFSRRRSDGCTVHLPLRRQATPLHPPNLRCGEMFLRSALLEHRLLTSERHDQMDMIWHHDRIRQNCPVTFEMEQAVQNDLRELGCLQQA